MHSYLTLGPSIRLLIAGSGPFYQGYPAGVELQTWDCTCIDFGHGFILFKIKLASPFRIWQWTLNIFPYHYTFFESLLELFILFDQCFQHRSDLRWFTLGSQSISMWACCLFEYLSIRERKYVKSDNRNFSKAELQEWVNNIKTNDVARANHISCIEKERI